MPIEKYQAKNQRWRWPLIPFVSIGGALLIAYLFRIIGSFSLSLGGFPPSSWMQRYVLAAMVAGFFGSTLVKISFAVAPTCKLKVACVVAWSCFAFNLCNIMLAFVFSVESKPVLILGSISATIGAMAAFSEKKSVESDVHGVQSSNNV